MKILHYSDRSDVEFPEKYKLADILVTTGDLTTFDLAALEDLVDEKPRFGVYGNHDTAGYMEKYGITNLHLKTINLNGKIWGGFQGCPRYKESGEFQYTEDEAKDFYLNFPKVDVLLLHAGPKGMLDDDSPAHIGSEFVARYVQEKTPEFVFVGHQYEDGEMSLGQTKLYRTFGARIIEITI
jgi:Icc-related predicted phosphoesterase